MILLDIHTCSLSIIVWKGGQMTLWDSSLTWKRRAGGVYKRHFVFILRNDSTQTYARMDNCRKERRQVICFGG